MTNQKNSQIRGGKIQRGVRVSGIPSPVFTGFCAVTDARQVRSAVKQGSKRGLVPRFPWNQRAKISTFLGQAGPSGGFSVQMEPNS